VVHDIELVGVIVWYCAWSRSIVPFEHVWSESEPESVWIKTPVWYICVRAIVEFESENGVAVLNIDN
jgi:hypothetical protein